MLGKGGGRQEGSDTFGVRSMSKNSSAMKIAFAVGFGDEATFLYGRRPNLPPCRHKLAPGWLFPEGFSGSGAQRRRCGKRVLMGRSWFGEKMEF